MFFSLDYMQRIIVHNKTNYDITNISLTHSGTGPIPTKIKEIKPENAVTTSLYTLKVIKECNLILSCDWNGNHIESVIYDKLSPKDLRIISIFIGEKDSSLEFKVLVSNDIDYM